jgi:hypothetical protein
MNMPSPKSNPIGRLEREIRSLTGRLSKSSSSTGAEIAEIQAAIAGIESQIEELIEQGIEQPEELENYRKALIAMFPRWVINIYQSPTWGAITTVTSSDIIGYDVTPGKSYMLHHLITGSHFLAICLTRNGDTAEFEMMQRSVTIMIDRVALSVYGQNQYRNTMTTTTLEDGTSVHRYEQYYQTRSVFGQNIYITNGAPASPQVGDIWFDISILNQ